MAQLLLYCRLEIDIFVDLALDNSFVNVHFSYRKRKNLISSLLSRFGFSTKTFFTGEFCGSNTLEGNHNVGHLHFVRRGPVTMVHPDGSSITAVEPTVIFYPRPFAHRLVVEPGTQAELVCAEVIFKAARNNPLALALPAYMATPLHEARGMGDVIDILCEEALAGEQQERFVLNHLCDILVFQLIRLAIKTNQIQAGVLAGLTDPGIAKALNAVHRDPAQDWNLERLAEKAVMSRTRFAERFHALVGITPARYVADWRLSMAEQLLRQNLSVKRVAEAVGYLSQRSFTRAFTEKNGIPPKEWLRRQEPAGQDEF